MTMQIRRRLGSPGAPTSLAEGQFGYNDPGAAVNDDQLFIGSLQGATATVRTLVSSQRQVELAGAQTITGAKTISISNLKVTGGSANDIVTTDGAGNLTFTAAPSGGLLAVATDGTLSGNGTSATPLSVQHLVTARNISLQAAAAAADGSKTTFTTITPASFDGSADALVTNIAISLDDGVY